MPFTYRLWPPTGLPLDSGLLSDIGPSGRSRTYTTSLLRRLHLPVVLQTDIGGSDRSRTCNPLRARQVLSQLSYTPTVRSDCHAPAYP